MESVGQTEKLYAQNTRPLGASYPQLDRKHVNSASYPQWYGKQVVAIRDQHHLNHQVRWRTLSRQNTRQLSLLPSAGREMNSTSGFFSLVHFLMNRKGC